MVATSATKNLTRLIRSPILSAIRSCFEDSLRSSLQDTGKCREPCSPALPWRRRNRRARCSKRRSRSNIRRRPETRLRFRSERGTFLSSGEQAVITVVNALSAPVESEAALIANPGIRQASMQQSRSFRDRPCVRSSTASDQRARPQSPIAGRTRGPAR